MQFAMFSELNLTVTSWMEHVLFNVQINKFLHLAFPKGIKTKVLNNYTGHWSTINIRFMCNICWSRMSSWLTFLAKNQSTSSVSQSFSTISSYHLCPIHILDGHYQFWKHNAYILSIDKLIILIFSYENTILLVTKNLV